MMDNATFRANMENAVNAANVKCHTPIKDPGIQDLLTRLGELVRTNNGLSYQYDETGGILNDRARTRQTHRG